MPDPLRQLICDTLAYLKDPLLPKQTIFATEEDAVFFQRAPSPRVIEKPVQPLPVKVQQRPLPPIPSELPVQKKPLQPILDKPLREEPVLKAEPKPMPPIKEPSNAEGFSQIKKTLLRAAPGIRLVEEVLDDSAAKRVANAWKEKIHDAQVVLLACETDAGTLELLKSLGKAIDQNLAKAKILPAEKMERDSRWDLFLQKNQFRLIIASDGLQKLPHLMRFYKALPATSEYYLDKTPLLALSPASVYKSLEAKAHLWKTLCQMLKK